MRFSIIPQTGKIVKGQNYNCFYRIWGYPIFVRQTPPCHHELECPGKMDGDIFLTFFNWKKIHWSVDTGSRGSQLIFFMVSIGSRREGSNFFHGSGWDGLRIESSGWDWLQQGQSVEESHFSRWNWSSMRQHFIMSCVRIGGSANDSKWPGRVLKCVTLINLDVIWMTYLDFFSQIYWRCHWHVK